MSGYFPSLGTEASKISSSNSAWKTTSGVGNGGPRNDRKGVLVASSASSARAAWSSPSVAASASSHSPTTATSVDVSPGSADTAPINADPTRSPSVTSSGNKKKSKGVPLFATSG